MRILAIERELAEPIHSALHELLRTDAAAIWDMTKRGVIRDIWCTNTTDRRAILMLECANATEAKKHLATLPLVQSGLIDFTIHELQSYDGFERLLGFSPVPVATKPEEPPEY